MRVESAPWRRCRSRAERPGCETASASSAQAAAAATTGQIARLSAGTRTANNASTATVSSQVTRSNVATAAAVSTAPLTTVVRRSSCPPACSASANASAQTQTRPSAGGYSKVPPARQTPAIRSASGGLRRASPASPAVAVASPSASTISGSHRSSAGRAAAPSATSSGSAVAASAAAVELSPRFQASDARFARATAASPPTSATSTACGRGRNQAAPANAIAANASWPPRVKPPCQSATPKAGAMTTTMGDHQGTCGCR